MAKQEEAKAQAEHLGALTLTVKSKILEGIARELLDPKLAATTMYTKSDGTNYGMYQKADPTLVFEEIWQTISGMRPAANVAPPQINVQPKE